MTKIAFITTNRDALEPLRSMLVAEKYQIDTYHECRSALVSIQRRMPDLIVIDLQTTKTDGVSLLLRIRLQSIVPVILLSAARDEIDEIMGLRSGADDYVHAPVSPRLMVERINAQLRRHGMLEANSKSATRDDKTLACGDLVMNPARHEVYWKKSKVSLTATEFQMLKALVHRPGIVRTRDQLMTATYSDAACFYERTIDSHIKRIRRKLRCIDPGFSCIDTLYGIGYRFSPPNDNAWAKADLPYADAAEGARVN